MNEQLQEDIEWLRGEIAKEDARARKLLPSRSSLAEQGLISNPWNDRLERILAALQGTPQTETTK